MYTMKCLKCGGPLVAIGSERVNGKCHMDWATRKYHKQCFKELVPCVIYFGRRGRRQPEQHLQPDRRARTPAGCTERDAVVPV